MNSPDRHSEASIHCGRVLLLLMVSTFFACGGAEDISADDLTTAKSSSLSVEAANQAGAFVALVANGIATAQTGLEAAQAASALTSLFAPSGCATATTATNQVTYTLANCTGPYGMVKMTGTVTAKFSLSGLTALDIEVSSTGLKVGGATLNLAANATYQKGSSSYTLSVASTTNGQSSRAGSISQMGMYTIGWDASCIQLDGSFSTTILQQTWTTSVAGYERCGSACPKSNGMVTVTGPSNRSITVSYSGGGTAFATTSEGQSGMIALPCAD